MSISEVLEGKSIFVTGGSGFIGKLLIEKLLRSCPRIKNVYILLRPKRSSSIQERMTAILDVPLFDKLKRDNIEVLRKVVGVEGDITRLNLGLNEKDTKTIIDNVSIIYHIAASVRFDDLLKNAILTNTRSTREVISLAKQCKTLDVFVYCSTVYCNHDKDIIEEKVYQPKQDWRIAIELAEKYDEMTLQVFTEKCIHPLPNTYTYTKGLAEQLVVDLCTNQIPAIIIRPSIVLPTIRDPIGGWVDNFNGPMILNLLAGKGLLKVGYGDANMEQDYVFADNTVKVLLIAAWQKSIRSNTSVIEVFNVASDLNYTINFSALTGSEIICGNPPESYLWTANTVFVSNYIIFYITTIIYHILPALVLDIISCLVGKKPRLIKLYRKVMIANVSLHPFVFKTDIIRTENYLGLEESLLESDKRELSFMNTRMPVNSRGTKEALGIIWSGMKVHLMKEKRQATETEIKRYMRIMVLHKMAFLAVRCCIGFLVITKICFPSIIYK